MAITKGIELTRSLQIEHWEIHLDNLACVQALHNEAATQGECAHDLIFCPERSKLRGNGNSCLSGRQSYS